MSDKLPSEADRALAAVAAGKGREPTAAHPDCTCVSSREYGQGRHNGEVFAASRRKCTVHGGRK